MSLDINSKSITNTITRHKDTEQNCVFGPPLPGKFTKQDIACISFFKDYLNHICNTSLSQENINDKILEDKNDEKTN